MAEQDINLTVRLPPEAMDWVYNSAHNYEVSCDDYLKILLQNEIRRSNEIASEGHTNCDCGRNIKANSVIHPITTNPRNGKPFLGYDKQTDSKKFLCYYDQEHGVFYNEYDCEMNPTHWEKAPGKP